MKYSHTPLRRALWFHYRRLLGQRFLNETEVFGQISLVWQRILFSETFEMVAFCCIDPFSSEICDCMRLIQELRDLS